MAPTLSSLILSLLSTPDNITDDLDEIEGQMISDNLFQVLRARVKRLREWLVSVPNNVDRILTKISQP
jgi:hypothetical protein